MKAHTRLEGTARSAISSILSPGMARCIGPFTRRGRETLEAPNRAHIPSASVSLGRSDTNDLHVDHTIILADGPDGSGTTSQVRVAPDATGRGLYQSQDPDPQPYDVLVPCKADPPTPHTLPGHQDAGASHLQSKLGAVMSSLRRMLQNVRLSKMP